MVRVEIQLGVRGEKGGWGEGVVAAAERLNEKCSNSPPPNMCTSTPILSPTKNCTAIEIRTQMRDANPVRMGRFATRL